MDLSSLDSLYASTEAKAAPGALPDGKYDVAVHMVELKETSADKRPMLAWQLKVLSGPNTGRMLFKNSVIAETTMSYVKQDLTCVGWDRKLSDLSDPLARSSLLDVQIEVTQKSKPGPDGKTNTNLYFNRRISAAAAAATVAAGGIDPNAAPF